MRELNGPAWMGSLHAKEPEQEPVTALGSHLLRGSCYSAAPNETTLSYCSCQSQLQSLHTVIASISKLKMQISPLTRLQGPKQATASMSLTNPCPRRL